MATNATSYDLIADLLSTNNTLNVAAFIGSFFFGVLAVYGCFLTWRHQRWERHLKDGGVIDAGSSYLSMLLSSYDNHVYFGRSDALEAGIRAESYGTRDRNTVSDDRTALEVRSAGTIAGSVSSSPSASSTLVAEVNIQEPTKPEDLVWEGDGDGQGHMKDRQHDSQRAENMQAANLGPRVESGTPTPSHTTSRQVESITDADHDGIAIDKSGSVAKTAV